MNGSAMRISKTIKNSVISPSVQTGIFLCRHSRKVSEERFYMNGVDYDIDWDCISEVSDCEEISDLIRKIYGYDFDIVTVAEDIA